MSFLKSKTVADVLKAVNPGTSPALIVLEHTDSVSDALKTLTTYGILSAPVFNREQNLYYGSLDVLDLVTFVLNVPQSLPSWIKDVVGRFRRPIIEAIDASRINPFIPILSKSPLLDTIAQFFSVGVHRIPVVNDGMELTHIFAQMDVIVYLNQIMDKDTKLQELGKQTMQSLDLIPAHVISVNDHCTLLKAFDVIIAHDINGVAIENSHRELVGNISASDFKGITEENFLNLEVPVGLFIRSQKPIVCSKESTLSSVIKQFAETQVHRIYIVDEKFHPIGVVSLTDVMKIVSARY